MRRFLVPPSTAVLALLAGCRAYTSGLHDDTPPAPDAALDASAANDAQAQPPSDDRPPRPDRPNPAVPEASSVAGVPEDVGCADGTREGFLDVDAWRNIAGCAGAWDVPGLLMNSAVTPQCDRMAGNSGLNSAGLGCGVADLCAPGWRVCKNADEVARRSPTDCESAQPPGPPLFFLVQSAASPLGICGPDRTASNDLHGCGNLGQPEAQTCQPLERRMGFSDCQATGGVWNCGGSAEHLREASVVTKHGPDLGGVLCCRTIP